MKKLLVEMGGVVLFGGRALRVLLGRGVRREALVDQMYAVGVRSLPTTVVTGLFVGAIMAIQISLQLRDFGAQGFLGGLSTSVTIRNVGPVLIAFILSGKVGAYTSAELATMQVTAQMDAIRCLGKDPIEYLIVPRLLAVVITSFLLLIVGLLTAIGGGVLISSVYLGVNPTNYTSGIATLVSGWSIGTGVIKSFTFGWIIALLACFHGYHASGGSVGVGLTVKRTAVHTLVSIIVADFALSSVSMALAQIFLSEVS